MIVQAAINQFMLANEADGLSPKTLIWYRYMLMQFNEHYGEREMTRISANDCRRYLAGLRRKDYSADSIYDFHRGLHRFWRWSEREFDIQNPMRNIEYPKQPKPSSDKAVDPADVVKLLLACDTSLWGRRDKAIIGFLFDTGCRAGGLCYLRRSDVDIPRGRAYVVEKGDKRRAVLFTDFTALLLTQWLAVRDDKLPFFFHGRLGNITPSGLYQITRKIKRRAKITGRANPHSFRHGFAKEYLLNGGDLATLAQILGNDPDVVARFYSIYATEELAQMHSQHSPMAKIKSLFKNGPEGRF